MRELVGEVGCFAVGALKRAVWQCNAEGRPVTLDIGPGWISKPFKITGDQAAINALAVWMRAISQEPPHAR